MVYAARLMRTTLSSTALPQIKPPGLLGDDETHGGLVRRSGWPVVSDAGCVAHEKGGE